MTNYWRQTICLSLYLSYPQSHSPGSAAFWPQQWSRSSVRSPCNKLPLWWSHCSQAQSRHPMPTASGPYCRRPTYRETWSQNYRQTDKETCTTHNTDLMLVLKQRTLVHLSHRSSLGPHSGCCPANPGRLMWSLMIMMSPTLKSGQIPPEAFVTSTDSTPINLKILIGNVTWDRYRQTDR